MRNIPRLENARPNGENSSNNLFFSRLKWIKPTRLTIFTSVFLLCALISLSYVFLRPAIYQSYATLLTVARTAVDQVSRDADIQHVAIQKQVLLGTELLTETVNRLQDKNYPEVKASLTPAEIRTMLDVRPVIDTNLVEMVAEGNDPALLPAIINTWIDVYLEARAEEIANSKGTTIRILQDELTALSEKLEQKRDELAQFRKHNDIVSAGREENEALARLKGLNNSLNAASEEEVKEKSRLDSIKDSIAKGRTVVTNEDSRTLSALERRAQELREQLEELDRNYTREFMALTPSLKVIPEKLAVLEAKILRMRQEGQATVLNQAEQEYAAAKQATQSIQEQLNLHRQKAAEFTARFTEHEALKIDLEGLEQLFRDTQGRLVQIETKNTGKYPYVDVIERAFLPYGPVRPDYQWDAMVAVLASLLLGLAAVWVVEFLTRKEQEKLAIHLSGIHLHNDSNNLPHGTLNTIHSTARTNLDQKPLPALEQEGIELLSNQQVKELFQAANIKEKQFLILLLSGLALDEIAALQDNDIDPEHNILNIQGSSPREIPLHPILRTLYTEHGYCLTDPAGNSLNQEDLEALLACLQVDAGLPVTNKISTKTLRQTYIIYLVKQGIRLSDLEQIIGYIPLAELSDYGLHSPAGTKHTIETIDLFYPVLGPA